ncbi:putative leader peptide [Streptomyces sp. NPDC050560]|uniref:putative leader peptide n=1 Tax=Streptomyces sp. NPDC050560 TaxID=3365630 RepID=UPI003799E6FF
MRAGERAGAPGAARWSWYWWRWELVRETPPAGPTHPALCTYSRRHIDLQRVAAALCPA